MNKEIKAKWLTALRSGEFKQGRRALCIRGNFCCLGVLCEITPDIKKRVIFEDEIEFAYGSDQFWTSYLPPGLLAEAGLTEKDQEKLAGLNDIHIWTFEEIANWIEQSL